MRLLSQRLNHTGTVTLETERLTLRKIVLGDVASVFISLASDPDVMDGVGWDTSPTLASTEANIKALVQAYANLEKPQYYWLMEEKLTKNIVGMIFVDDYKDERRVAEVDYCIAKEQRGKGFAPEALRAVIRYLFDVVKFFRIEAVYNMDNGASGRVLEKVGMRFEGILRGRALRIGVDGFPEDLHMCAILATDEA